MRCFIKEQAIQAFLILIFWGTALDLMLFLISAHSCKLETICRLGRMSIWAFILFFPTSSESLQSSSNIRVTYILASPIAYRVISMCSGSVPRRVSRDLSALSFRQCSRIISDFWFAIFVLGLKTIYPPQKTNYKVRRGGGSAHL